MGLAEVTKQVSSPRAWKRVGKMRQENVAGVGAQKALKAMISNVSFSLKAMRIC